LLQARTKVLNNELEDVFRRWYPQFRTEEKGAHVRFGGITRQPGPGDAPRNPRNVR